jgi:hypothetical protein
LRIAVMVVFGLLMGAWVVTFSLAIARLASRPPADATAHVAGHRAQYEVEAHR